MRNGHQAFFRNQLAGAAADTITFIGNTHQRGFQLVDKFFLTGGKLIDRLLFQRD